MPNTKAQLIQRFESLTMREQRMVVGALLLVVWGGWDNFFYQPLLKDQQRLETEINQLNLLFTSQKILASALETAGNNDPNAQNRQNLALLQQSTENLKQQLSAGDKRFIPSQLMATALRDMLKQHGNLQLIDLENLPPKPFGSPDQQTNWVYRHTMNLTLQGDYFSTLKYLKSMETLPWRIHWDSIDYKVDAYPQAQTRIQVYTLSFEQDWLGV